MSTESASGQTDGSKQERAEPLPKEITIKFDKQPITDLVSAIKEQTDEYKKTGEISKGIQTSAAAHEITANGVTHRISKKANTIAIIATIINTLIFIATLFIYFWNIKGIGAAVRATDIADSTFKISKKYDSLSLDRQDSASASGDREWRKRFSLDSTSTAEQIKALRGSLLETKREFEIANRPYLQISKPFQDTIALGRPFGVKFTLENLGNYPVKILDYKFLLCWSIDPPDKKLIDDREKEIESLGDNYFLVNRYVIKERPLESEISDSMRKETYEMINSKRLITYFFGFMRYQNIITKRKGIYKFRIEIETKSGAWGEFKYNDNEDISEKEASKPVRLEYWQNSAEKRVKK